MVIVRFHSGTDWYKANWIFRQFANDAAARFASDSSVKDIMEQALSHGGLFLDSLESSVAVKVLGAIKTTARETIEGTIPGWKNTKPDGPEGAKMYLDAITELLDHAERD